MAFAQAASLPPQALLEFGLPAMMQRIEELPSPRPGVELCCVQAASGRYLIVYGQGALALAFEATLYDLLAESRFPAPRPLRAKDGGLLVRVQLGGGTAGAACYAWPSGESVSPVEATLNQLLEVGRLLARLHQIGEAHPASVVEPLDSARLARSVPASPETEALRKALATDLSALPAGAAHGQLGPRQALLIGERCSAVLPSGTAHAGPLVGDLARAVAAWALELPSPAPAVRAIASGYQAQRRLAPEEREAFFAAIRAAAARAGALRLLQGERDALGPLRAVEAIGEREIRSAVA